MYRVESFSELTSESTTSYGSFGKNRFAFLNNQKPERISGRNFLLVFADVS